LNVELRGMLTPLVNPRKKCGQIGKSNTTALLGRARLQTWWPRPFPVKDGSKRRGEEGRKGRKFIPEMYPRRKSWVEVDEKLYMKGTGGE